MVLSAFVMDGTTIVNARVYPVHLMNAEQRRGAADLWTKPMDHEHAFTGC